MDEVMKKFDQTDAAQLPVVDTAGVLVGYISRTKVYSVYRKIVADMSASWSMLMVAVTAGRA